MLLRHATPARNLPSILAHGLLAAKSKGRMKVVWLHSAGASNWAVLHTVKRHGGKVESVVIIEVDVPRSKLRRNRKRLWHTGDVPPGCFRRVITFGELAGRSADEHRLAVAR